MLESNFDRYAGDNEGEVIKAVGPSRYGNSEGRSDEGLNKEERRPVRAIVKVAFWGSAGSDFELVGGGAGIFAIALRIDKRFDTVRLSCENKRTSWDVRRR